MHANPQPSTLRTHIAHFFLEVNCWLVCEDSSLWNFHPITRSCDLSWQACTLFKVLQARTSWLRDQQHWALHELLASSHWSLLVFNYSQRATGESMNHKRIVACCNQSPAQSELLAWRGSWFGANWFHWIQMNSINQPLISLISN